MKRPPTAPSDAVFALAHGSGHAPPLGRLTLADAASRHGQVVRVTFEVGQPVDHHGWWSVKYRCRTEPGVWQGHTVAVIGVTKVVTIPAAAVNGAEGPRQVHGGSKGCG